MKFAVKKRRAPSIIIVSLVDILTILLIFFVVSTTFKKDQPEVQINLPESKTATNAPAESEHAVVSVDQNDEIKLDGKTSVWMNCRGGERSPADAQISPRLAGRQEGVVRHDHQSDGRVETGGREKSARLYARGKMRLSILQYGDPILRAKGKRIDKIDDRIRELAANMLETMHAANGVGLAAQQVGEAMQLTVLDVSQVEDRPSTMTFNGEHVDPKTKMPLVLINPEITLGKEMTLERKVA